MAFHPYPFMIAVSLIPALLACSSAVPPSLDSSEIAAPALDVSTAELTLHPEPAAPPEVPDPRDLVRLVSDKDQPDERFFRPLLRIDDSALPLPKALPEGAEVSYVVIDLDRGTTIAQHNGDRDHIPASAAKLATAVVALQHLGPDHRFRTEIRTTGPIENGILKGDLILKGGGDPLLDIPDLVSLIDDLARLPLRHVEGQFLIDDSLLPRFTEIEPSQPTEAGYNPSVGALSLAFNRVKLRWENRSSLRVETLPHLDEASFERAGSDHLPPCGVQLKQFDGREAVWQLADRGARRLKRSLPVKDPGLYAGSVFVDLASLHGIHLPLPKRAVFDTESQLLAFHESRPLRELVRDMLWYSNNLVAELIGLATVKTVEPDLTSLEKSADVVLSMLEEQLS
ncbi:MAG: D-alanyl-D-alanine carboxypeptidase/D-alanyl-D-alanine endopeptidase, partial [Geminicoccaceae bacterium]